MFVDLSKLIAATADPLDSFSACVVSSSRASVSQQNSQVRASRDRPSGIRGTNGALNEAFRGICPMDKALWLL